MITCPVVTASWMFCAKQWAAERHLSLCCLICVLLLVTGAFLITVGEYVSRANCIGSVKIILIFPTRSELIFLSHKKDSIRSNSYSTWGANSFLMLSGQRSSDMGDCTLWTTFYRVTNMTVGDPDSIPRSDDQTFPRFSTKRASVMMRQIANWSLRRRHV